MSDINKVILTGRLVADPELGFTQGNQTARTKMRLAVNRKYKDSRGELVEEATFVTVIVWGKQGESCSSYLSKGSQIAVEGRLRIYSYGGEDGGEKKYATEVVAENVTFLSGGGGGRPKADTSDLLAEAAPF